MLVWTRALAGAFLLSAIAIPAVVAAQSVLDEVGECDVLAAHPADPQRVSDGVPDAAIVPRLALRACDQAARAGGNDLRHVYQYGRALLAAGRPDQAREQFAKAAGASYPAAVAAAADLALAERPPALPSAADAEGVVAAIGDWGGRLGVASSAHGRAAAGGFSPSRQRAQALAFDGGDYTHPMLGQIASGRFAEALATAGQPQTRAYLYAFTTNLIAQCGPAGLPPAAVARLAVYRFGAVAQAGQDDAPIVGIQPLVGEIDAQRFVRRHGCEGTGVQGLFYFGLAGFLEAQARAR
jgi:hypothetical protein